MNKRALLIALVAALLGGFLLLLYFRRFEQQASGGDRVRLLMAIKPIERGKIITDDALATRDVPLAYVEDRAVKASERAKVLGLRVGNGVQAQQTLLWTDLAIATDERRDLSSLVQPGNRAVSIRASSDDKSFALIHPGDYVDVVAIMQQGPGGSDAPRSAVVLLQKVLVLASGLETAADQLGVGVDKKDLVREMVLTLSLNLQETQLLSLAAEKGRLTVALRNPDDQRIVEGIPDMPSTALTDTKARGDVQRIRRAGPVRIEGPR